MNAPFKYEIMVLLFTYKKDIRHMRGRPPKEKYHVNLGMSEHPTQIQIEGLETELRKLIAVNDLGESDRKKLLLKLLPEIGFYTALEKARLLAPAESQGNKNKSHIQRLLFECAKQWAEITSTEPSIWEKDRGECSGGAHESTSVSLAKAIIKASSGKYTVQSYRAQAKKARQIIPFPISI